jgi:hypothetical protein
MTPLWFAAVAFVGCGAQDPLDSPSEQAQSLSAVADSSKYSADCKSVDPTSDATVAIREHGAVFSAVVKQTKPVRVHKRFSPLVNQWSGDFDNFSDVDGLFHVLIGPPESPANVELYSDKAQTHALINLPPGHLGCTFQGTTQH